MLAAEIFCGTSRRGVSYRLLIAVPIATGELRGVVGMEAPIGLCEALLALTTAD